MIIETIESNIFDVFIVGVVVSAALRVGTAIPAKATTTVSATATDIATATAS